MLCGEMISYADGNGKEVEAEAAEGGQSSHTSCNQLRGTSTDNKNKDGLVWEPGGDLCLGVRVIAEEIPAGRCQQLQGEVHMVLEEYGLPKRALFLCRCLRKAESWCHSKNMGRAGELGNWLFKLSFIKGYALPKMFQNRIWLLTCFVSFILILRSIYPISRKVGNIFLAAGKAQGLCCWVTGSRQVIIFVKCNNIAFGTEENLI